MSGIANQALGIALGASQQLSQITAPVVGDVGKFWKATAAGEAGFETPEAGGVKASGAELDTGTDDAKFATAKALKDSHNVPSVVPSTSGNVLTSNGTDWTSAAAGAGASIYTSVKDFGAVGDNSNDDTAEISAALNSTADNIIYFPIGTYKITGTITVNAGTVKKMVAEKGTILSITLATSIGLFNFDRNIEMEGFIIDFNNGFVAQGIDYAESLGVIKLKDLQIINVKDTDTTTGTTFINISTLGNTVDIDGITFTNTLKKGNGTIGDAGGNITGIYLGDRVTPAPCNGRIRNIQITEMHNINAAEALIYEDTSGIYPITDYTGADGNLLIENVRGYNYGKRLIKINASNINISNIHAYSDTQDALAAIGMNAGNGIIIDGVQVYGNVSIGVAVNGTNVIINNAVIDIQKTTMAGSDESALGIQISSNNVTVNNFVITGEIGIRLSGASAVLQDIKISNGTFTIPSWGTHFISLIGTYGFQNLIIQNVTGINNSTGAVVANAFLTTNGGAKSKELNIINCAMYSAVDSYCFDVISVDDINITNFIHTNDMVTKFYRSAVFDTCKNVRITNFNAKIYVTAALQFSHCDNVFVDGALTPASDISLTFSDDTNVRLKNVDRNTLNLNDDVSRKNTVFETLTTHNTTALRPTIVHVGDMCYDTTLSIPIWCKTAGAFELDTLTVTHAADASGNVTITLNGVAVTVAVIAGDTIAQVATKIRAKSYLKWLAGGVAASAAVTFISTIAGVLSAPTIGAAATGVTGTFAVTTAGTASVWVNSAGTTV